MAPASLPIAVLGAGAWGTAAACVLAAGGDHPHDCVLWARDADQARAIATARENRRYLPGVILPPRLTVTADLDQALAGVRGGNGLIVVATTVAGLAPTIAGLAQRAGAPLSPALSPITWLCKGFDRDLLPHQIVGTRLPGHAAGPLSGPSFAQEVAAGQPAALTVAGPALLQERVTTAFHRGALRIYSTDDVIGVEVAGALKNVIAIATGVGDALALGQNARAALITRGLAEIARFGVALGASRETFLGLTGVGDLILTCTGELSRNRRIGLMLGRGVALEAALREIGHVAEGVRSAPAVVARAAALGIEMPISEAVAALIDGRLTPRAAVGQLLARDPRSENPT